jgi:protein-tyrosine phosphatase
MDSTSGVVELDVLVVCVGNVCRSPLAERLLALRLRQLLGTGADAVRVSSAGVLALVGSPMDQLAGAQLRRLGGDPEGFVATQWDASMSSRADLVLTATRDLRSRVLEDTPKAHRRTFTIPEFAALSTSDVFRQRRVASVDDLVGRAATWRGASGIDDFDVPDPYGQSEQVHAEIADLLDRDCSAIARALAGALLGDVSAHP